jgi:hypothetical protein
MELALENQNSFSGSTRAHAGDGVHLWWDFWHPHCPSKEKWS